MQHDGAGRIAFPIVRTYGPANRLRTERGGRDAQWVLGAPVRIPLALLKDGLDFGKRFLGLATPEMPDSIEKWVVHTKPEEPEANPMQTFATKLDRSVVDPFDLAG